MDIFQAVDAKDASLVEMLSTDVNKTDSDGNTPLHYAAMKNAVDVMKVLLRHGANPFKKNRRGSTPLDVSYIYDSDLPLYVKTCERGNK